ncbi:NYN domain-containing protein [Patescibacteria group bacterium]|nr:NYN domain-containing protein [Patescibacteria group bacterium]MBU4600662.1 NYN domain-containing protein [Patescibacteria group bacterium]MCG2698580.1 NYN domain-containing protein [Candidatus Parcubacteria bacterium]
MFKPKTNKIEMLADCFTKRIKELEKLFSGTVNMYVDYANVRPWSAKLGWNVDPKRLKQFLDSFDNINEIKFYAGTLHGDGESVKFIKKLQKYKYEVRTKLVKIMNISIDASSVQSQSTDLINRFIRPALVRKLDIETIEYLNNKFKEMNQKGIYFIQDRKCNFDVEIGRDMEIDQIKNNIGTFVLWSGDSDFAEPIEKLLDNGKQVILFATARRVALELNNLRAKGLYIFDIQKIRNFVCWRREIQKEILSSINAKETL